MARTRLLPRVGLLVISGIALLTVLFRRVFEAQLDMVLEITLVVLGLLALLVYVVLTFSAHTAVQRWQANTELQRDLDPDGVEYFFSRKGPATLSQAHGMSFIDALVYPKETFERISEQAESFHRSLMIKSTYTVSIHRKPPDGPQPDYVVPLFLFPKGKIQDGLKAFRGEDERVSTLSTLDMLTFATAVIRSLVFAAGAKPYKAYLGSLESEVIRVMTATSAPTDEELREVRLRVLSLEGASGDDVLDTAAAMIEELSKYHAVCVTIPSSDVREREWPWIFRFRLEYRTIPPLRAVAREPWWQRLGDGVRMALGVRLNRLFMPIPNAFRTGSYHLQVSGPPGTYLARQGTIPSEEDLVLRARYQPRRAQRRAHAYFQALQSKGEVLFATQFYERTPGSFAATTSAAWAAAVVVGMLAIREVFLPVASNTGGLSSLLPALLAVPIAVASWN